MAPPSPAHDILIVGGGPAGCAAAIVAARHQLGTLLIEPMETPCSPCCAAWVGPAGVRMCQQLGVDAAAAGAVEFRGVRLWPWDLSTPVDVRDPKLAGWIVHPQSLGTALLASARAAGAQVMRGCVTVIYLGEALATAQLSAERSVTGRVLVIADGAGSATARTGHLSAAPADESAGAQAVLGTPDDEGGLDVILGAGRTIKIATIARHRRQACVTLMTYDSASPATIQLSALLRAAGAAGLLPAAASAAPQPTPMLAGAALEMESHVGKRCLLIGDAGGFVSSFSHDGLYPALRSGWLAAETAARALTAAVLQDELATFSAAWRTELAEYVSMPNTDLGLLLPMVFGNPQMARRLAHAFLLGEPF